MQGTNSGRPASPGRTGRPGPCPALLALKQRHFLSYHLVSTRSRQSKTFTTAIISLNLRVLFRNHVDSFFGLYPCVFQCRLANAALLGPSRIIIMPYLTWPHPGRLSLARAGPWGGPWGGPEDRGVSCDRWGAVPPVPGPDQPETWIRMSRGWRRSDGQQQYVYRWVCKPTPRQRHVTPDVRTNPH